MDCDTEIWKPVIGYSGYFISSYGFIKSEPKKTRKSSRILKPIKVTGGYLAIDLVNEKVKRFLIHRLVGIHFLNNTENKEQINHKNGVKTDNRLINLEWVTHSENQKHSIKTGLRSAKGEKNSQCKLKKSDVIRIFNDHRKYSYIANDFKISIVTVSNIKTGYSWKHLKLIA